VLPELTVAGLEGACVLCDPTEVAGASTTGAVGVAGAVGVVGFAVGCAWLGGGVTIGAAVGAARPSSSPSSRHVPTAITSSPAIAAAAIAHVRRRRGDGAAASIDSGAACVGDSL
jgi:hypothetical protein